jgi:hypothetical protein
MAQHEHDTGEEQEGTVGMALGFRIVEDAGKLYLAEAEIAPYEDAPEELGVTLVFHPLDGIDPTDTEETDDPMWAVDIDDELARSTGDSLTAQFQAIVRQLHGLSEQQLREYLQTAQEEEQEGEEDL